MADKRKYRWMIPGKSSSAYFNGVGIDANPGRTVEVSIWKDGLVESTVSIPHQFIGQMMVALSVFGSDPHNNPNTFNNRIMIEDMLGEHGKINAAEIMEAVAGATQP